MKTLHKYHINADKCKQELKTIGMNNTSVCVWLTHREIISFLLRCMECRRGLAMRILSVRPSVCHTRGLWQNGRKICPHLYTIRKNSQPSFL